MAIMMDFSYVCLNMNFFFPGVCLWPSVATATSWSSTPHLWLESRPSWEWYVNVSDQCTKYDENRWRLNTTLKKKRHNSPKKTIRDPPLTCDGKADPLESGIFCCMINQKNYGYEKLFWETFKIILAKSLFITESGISWIWRTENYINVEKMPERDLFCRKEPWSGC